MRFRKFPIHTTAFIFILLLSSCAPGIDSNSGRNEFVQSSKSDAAIFYIDNRSGGNINIQSYEKAENCGGRIYAHAYVESDTLPPPLEKFIKLNPDTLFSFSPEYSKGRMMSKIFAFNTFSFLPERNGRYRLIIDRLDDKVFFNLYRKTASDWIPEPSFRPRDTAVMPLFNDYGQCAREK